MAAPQFIKNAVLAIALCLGLSTGAAIVDWLHGDLPQNKLVFSLLIYGAAALIPWKIAQRNNTARYMFLVFVAAIYLNWMRGLAPFPPWSSIALIVQIPIMVMLINWLFMAPGAQQWFKHDREADEPESRSRRVKSNP